MRRPHSRSRRWVRATTIVLTLAAAVWFVWHELPPVPVLAAAFGRVDVPLLAVAAALEALSFWFFARQQQFLFAGFGVHIPVGSALAITYSRSAMSMTFPGGSVTSAVFAVNQFRRLGADLPTATTVTVLSGLASSAGLCCLYLLGALAVLTLSSPSAVVIAVAGSLIVLYLGVWLLDRFGNPPCRTTAVLVQRSGGRLAAIAYAQLADLVSLPRRYWAAEISFAAANWAADLFCLTIVGFAFDLQVSIVQIGVIYLGIQLIRQIPISPGGIGVIETSLTASLIAAGGDNAAATAVTLGYRLLSCWLIIPIGLTAWLFLTHAAKNSECRSASV